MRWGPVRRMALGGIVVGVFVLVVGILFLLISQRVIPIELNLLAICSLAIILLGVVIVGGTLWGLRMARGGWRRWVEDWDVEGEDRRQM